MKVAIRSILTAVVILVFCVSCGRVVKETQSPDMTKLDTGEFGKVVIVPFADYTPAFSPYEHWRRNRLVVEAFEQELYRAGFIPAVEEDVVKYLVDQGVIKSTRELTKDVVYLEEELESDWSESMKEELKNVITNEMKTRESDREYGKERSLVALDSSMIRKLGRKFGADYIVRGRIIEFRSSEEDTFNPFKTGILSFYFKAGQRMIFGVADTDTYAMIDKVALGATHGGVAAHQFEWTGGAATHTGAWSAVGGGAGYLAHKGGKVPDAVVQVKAIVQDAGTGQVVWLNRAETRVVPKTAFAEHQREILFAEAVNQTVHRLVENFEASLAEGKVPEVIQAAPASTKEAAEEAERSAFEAKKAADDAETAAYKAGKSAEEAGEAAAWAKEAEEGAKRAAEKSEKVFEKTLEK